MWACKHPIRTLAGSGVYCIPRWCHIPMCKCPLRRACYARRMVARMLVAVLLSLAVAPVLRADSLSVLKDFCEGARLLDAAYERWAEDLPEGNSNWQLIGMHRSQVERRAAAADLDSCRPDPDSVVTQVLEPLERAEVWLMGESTLPMLNSVIGEAAGQANVESGLRRKLRNDRFMSVETLLLFTESKIYLTRAFLGALDARRDLERERLNLREWLTRTGSGP